MGLLGLPCRSDWKAWKNLPRFVLSDSLVSAISLVSLGVRPTDVPWSVHTKKNRHGKTVFGTTSIQPPIHRYISVLISPTRLGR
ncbi:hypothetical protein BDQ94DRAFT_141226 [Aspergillus welwitschiae]|uniref:Uncharacterized protein n=1 Tax=Aspergillus welwitschiae TaxID=1341132 RepID=A0A3F3Q702_9EURO|nr:hypothetical protein BDQ94DRAFT_141226 [Aspergillus welwitschiae]RDH34960.1 hypothetical protein BDQ94DRAFT_141226 [Aspergillus welwitschiae]